MLKKVLLCLLIFGPLIASSQQKTIFNEVELGESLENVQMKLQNEGAQLYVVEVEKPTFPLARNSEIHLICLDCKAGDLVVEEAAFTFSDGELSLVQAQGNAFEAVLHSRKDTAEVFMHYQVYWEDLIVSEKETDKIWIMSPDAAHPNLFAWDNPYLPSNGGKEQVYKQEAAIPEFLKMGGTLDQLKPALEEASSFTYTRNLPPGDPNAQLQIDCFGIEYAGFPRKFEARFGNDRLNMVWILTGKGEEERIKNMLIAEFGDPIFKNEAWEVFQDWQVYLRKDKPEVLLLTPELGQFYKVDYFKQ